MKEINECAMACDKVKHEREQSSKNVKWDRFNVAMASTGKSLMKLVRPNGSGDPIMYEYATRSA
jgi:hypothetical protein